jgi:hypothetical protein
MRTSISRFALTMARVCVRALLLGGLAAVGCQKPAPPAPATTVQLVPVAALPADPGDDAWRQAPDYTAALIPQDLVDPRLMQPSTASLRVRALTAGGRMAFRLAWSDA